MQIVVHTELQSATKHGAFEEKLWMFLKERTKPEALNKSFVCLKPAGNRLKTSNSVGCATIVIIRATDSLT